MLAQTNLSNARQSQSCGIGTAVAVSLHCAPFLDTMRRVEHHGAGAENITSFAVRKISCPLEERRDGE